MSNKGFKYCFHSLQQLKIKCLHLVHLLLCWVLSIAVCFLIFLFRSEVLRILVLAFLLSILF